jgi:hypothetical protein
MAMNLGYLDPEDAAKLFQQYIAQIPLHRERARRVRAQVRSGDVICCASTADLRIAAQAVGINDGRCRPAGYMLVAFSGAIVR